MDGIHRRAVLAHVEEDEDKRYILADMPADPPNQNAWVQMWDYAVDTNTWIKDDMWREGEIVHNLLMVVTIHPPTGCIAPHAQILKLDKLVAVASAHTVLVLEPGMVRVRDARVHTLCPLVLRYGTGAEPPTEDLPTALGDIIAYERGGPPSQATREAAAKTAAARRDRATGGGTFNTPRDTPQKAPPHPKKDGKVPPLRIKEHVSKDAPPKDALKPPGEDAYDPLADTDDEADTMDDTARGANPWHATSAGAALEVDAIYDLSWVHEGKTHTRRAKAVAVDKIRFEDLGRETTMYPPNNSAGITKLVCTLVSDPWKGRKAKTGIQHDDVTTMIPFFDTLEVRQILTTALDVQWKTAPTTGIGYSRRAALLADLMAWGTEYAQKPSPKELAKGTKIVLDATIALRALRETIPEDTLREKIDKLNGGLTELDRAVEAIRKERRPGDGGPRQPGAGGQRRNRKDRQPPEAPADRIPGTCDLCKEKGHIARNCAKNTASGARPKAL